MSQVENDNDDTSESLFNTYDKGEKVVLLEFTSGYPFRQLFEYGSVISNELPIYCTKNNVTTNNANDTKTIIVTNIISPQNLTKYVFNEEYANQGENNYHVINMNFSEARKYIKNIGKTGSVRLYQYINDPNNTYLQYFGDDDNDGEEICIPNVIYELKAYNVVEKNSRESSDPNVTVCLKTFCSKISEIQKIKYSKVIFRTFPGGIHIYCLDNKNKLIRTVPWGKSYPKNVSEKPSDAFDIILTEQFMKALVKTSTFHPDGIVRIYCSQDNLVRLEIPVSCFATNITYLTVPEAQ
jgi:hypothetical protein